MERQDDPKEIGRLVIKGEALLGHYAHPEAYKGEQLVTELHLLCI